ncbi:hypothetical protein [Pseudomonas brassicacearum]|uniref:hypothetical protein n=1 Tax=Pseudomonas brassicacearum TaxID=930166 RepID=UPI000F49FEDA|nr:hypothetical protein [Pseudomonas brassicacearum]
MKRKQKHPVRLIESPPTAMASATLAHPPFWHYVDELHSSRIYPRGTFAFLSGSFGFLAVLLFTLPFYGVALLLITLVEAVKGLPLTYAQTLTEPTFFVPLIGTALMAAGMLSFGISSSAVTAFSFDEARQQLTFTQTRRLGKAIERQVPFSDILWISAYVLSSYGRSGHFQIGFVGPKGKFLKCHLGRDFPVAEMEFHIVWLKGLIGERISDICWLDT